jgi:hypothetical protein
MPNVEETIAECRRVAEARKQRLRPRDVAYGECDEKPRIGVRSLCPVKNRHEYGGEVEEWMAEFGFGRLSVR